MGYDAEELNRINNERWMPAVLEQNVWRKMGVNPVRLALECAQKQKERIWYLTICGILIPILGILFAVLVWTGATITDFGNDALIGAVILSAIIAFVCAAIATKVFLGNIRRIPQPPEVTSYGESLRLFEVWSGKDLVKLAFLNEPKLKDVADEILLGAAVQVVICEEQEQEASVQSTELKLKQKKQFEIRYEVVTKFDLREEGKDRAFYYQKARDYLKENQNKEEKKPQSAA